MTMKRAIRLAMAVMVAGVSVATVRAGVSYTAVTKAEGGPPEAAAMQAMTMKVAADGSSARMEFMDSGNPMMPAGGYMLTSDAGKSVYLVDPAARSYTRWDLDKMMGGMGDMMEAMKGMVTMKFLNPKVEKVLDEAGPQLHGYATRHCKFVTSYTLATTMMGMTSESNVRIEDEVWSTDSLKDEALQTWNKSQRVKTGNASLDEMIRLQMDSVQGFPLKKISTTANTTMGATQESKTVMEVTELKEASVPASTFTLPEGFREVAAPTMGGMGMMGAGAPPRGGPPAGGQPPALPPNFPFTPPAPTR